jgi:hypothetical protein
MAYQDADFGGRKALPRYNAPGNSARAAVRGRPGVLDQALQRGMTRTGGQRDGDTPMFGHEGWLARGRVPLGATPRGINAGAPSTGARPIDATVTDRGFTRPSIGIGDISRQPMRPAPMQLPNIAPSMVGTRGVGSTGAPGQIGGILSRVLGGQGGGMAGIGAYEQRQLQPGLQTGLTNPTAAPSGFWSGIQTPNSRGMGTPNPYAGQPLPNFANMLGLGGVNYRPNPNIDYSRIPMT